MLKFLRYNTRHNFYYHPVYKDRREAKVLFGWSLNPISSMYDGKQKSFHEPLWLFRLRQRVFAFAGRQRCGRRGEAAFDIDGRGKLPLPDTWDMGPDENRTCSYCGSIHFDDLMKICRLIPDDPRYAIEGTTKSYKVYVKQPGVVNAGQGAIKFYMHHAPSQPSKEDQKLFAEAVHISNERHAAMMERWRQERQAASA
jgi:hypothetical protein